jgi:hypothetical protein
MNPKTCPRSRRVPPRLVAAVVSVTAATVAGWWTPASAQPVDGNPNPSGMPGAALVSQLINWLMWVSLMASLGAVLYGAAMWRGGAKMGNTPRAEDGRNYVAGGAVGALLAGLAVVLINTLFEVGRAGG